MTFSFANVFTIAFTTFGLAFFIAGTVGLLRFPDVHSRLHALTKADNLGLGLMVLGLLPQTDSVWTAVKLLLVWALAILAAGTTSQLIARAALPRELRDAPESGPHDTQGGRA
ncbi:monovalent cation/H(+) antiporter subunit G [Hydrogenophaga sp.]|uniref:cation:proton antiporter n=1 Tax=Hydrogenophaga sp. TaxID=1904254 RepID=UPI00271710FA|nr:monovalent cation/H(+) antiporter subunit G [Hydrogenophaga sp.]MDO8904810.1 monovalent cation/H(+) antiporter subunit G [Hydrogenophaga sp.]